MPDARRDDAAGPHGDAPPAGRHELLVRAAVLLAAGGALSWHLVRTIPGLDGPTLDDAYIYLRYAKHFLAGAGFSWNVADGPVHGTTSTLHLLTVTALRAFTSLPDPLVLTLVSFSAGLVALVVLVILAHVTLPAALRRLWVPLLVVPILLGPRKFAFHSLTGMETTLSLLCNALLVLCVVLFCRSRSRTLLACAIAAGYGAFLARPDNGVYGLLFPPLFFVACDRRLVRPAASYVGALVAILALDAALKNAIFGEVIPLSFYAKRAGFYRGYLGSWKWNAGGSMLEFMAACLPFLATIAWLGDRRSLPRVAAFLVPAGITFAYLSTVNQIMGYAARYYYPSLPYVAGAAFAVAQAASPRISVAPPAFVRVLAIAVMLVLAVPVVRGAAAGVWERYLTDKPTPFAATGRYVTRTRETLPLLGQGRVIAEAGILCSRTPFGTVFTASEYGYVGAVCPDTDIVDLVGLHDPMIAHEGFSVEHALARRPDVIWFPHPDYSYATKEILDSDVFATSYDYYPGTYDFGLAVFRGSPRYSAIMGVLAAEFSRAYPGRSLADYRAIRDCHECPDGGGSSGRQ